MRSKEHSGALRSQPAQALCDTKGRKGPNVSPQSYPAGSVLASEIAQQPAVWPTTLGRLRAQASAFHFDELPIILTGAGTSAYAASAIAEAWPSARAIPSTDLLVESKAAMLASIPRLREGGWLISLARSGDSPESTAVVEKFQTLFPEVRHLAIVCNEAGRLAHLPGVDVLALDPRTNDRSLAMTGSFSNLVLAGLCLTRHQEIAQHLPTICNRVEHNLQTTNDAIEQIARSAKDRVVILSSAMQALSKEVALKIVELTDGRVSAMPETFLGFRHGPVGYLRPDTPVIGFLSSDPHRRLYEMDLLEDLRVRGLGRHILVGDHALSQTENGWHIPASAPMLPDTLRTPFEVAFGQLLAYHLSVHAQVNPDNPSPTGAITRVVRPFRLHGDGALS